MTATCGVAFRAHRLEAARRVEHAAREGKADGRRRVAEERLRIARELHDVLAHTVVAIAVQASVGAEALEERPAETRHALDAIRSAARDALTELRATVGPLREEPVATRAAAGPAAPADGLAAPVDRSPTPGLAQIRQLAERAEAAGLTVRLSTDVDPLGAAGPPAAVGLAAYRITQEALTNVLRHAHARCVEIRVARDRSAVTVSVTDDGPATGPVVAGHGLLGMRERAASVGGSVEVTTRPGGGVRVLARLPARPVTGGLAPS